MEYLESILLRQYGYQNLEISFIPGLNFEESFGGEKAMDGETRIVWSASGSENGRSVCQEHA